MWSVRDPGNVELDVPVEQDNVPVALVVQLESDLGFVLQEGPGHGLELVGLDPELVDLDPELVYLELVPE